MIQCFVVIVQGNGMNKTPLSEKERKVKIAEANDILDAIGQESEKAGISETKRFMDLYDQKQWHENQLKKAALKSSSRYSKMEYYRRISAMLQEELTEIEFPNGYIAWSEYTEGGVIMRLKDRWGGKWLRAFKPDGTPEVDFNAVVGLLVDTQDTIDKLEAKARKSMEASGFILPS
jgi:hypothetical protein